MNIWTKLAAFSFVETHRTLLRPFFYTDAVDFYQISSNPANLEFIFPSQSILEEAQYALANYFMKNPLGTWAICNQDNQLIGAIRFEKLDEIKLEAEIGYFLRQDYWGQGLMPEVLQELVFLSFQEFGLKSLKIIVHLENQASRRVAEKAGFKQVRQYKGSDRYTRKMRDYLEFRYERGDFYE